jgi:dipeptidase E
MNNIYLASSISNVASSIAKEIENTKKKLVFITTASELDKGKLEWLKNDRKSLVDSGFNVTDYTFTNKNKNQINFDLKNFDIIAVAGGNTFYLLKMIQQSNCAETLRTLIGNGKIYIGSSAGSIIAGPNIYPAYSKEEAEEVPDLEDYTGLNLTDVIIMPHWGSPVFKESYLKDTMEKAYTPDYKMVLLSDTQYVITNNDNYRIIDIAKE